MQAPRNAQAQRAAKSVEAAPIMTIQCAHGHHLGRVIDTTHGLVIETALHRRSHGRRDLHSDPHGVDEPSLWWDFLEPDQSSPSGDPFVDDTIPVGCACGDRVLSRATIDTWVREGDHRPIID